MIKSIFAWLDRYPDAYWFLALCPTVWVVVRILRFIAQDCRIPAPLRDNAGWADALALFLFLSSWRWPFLFVAHDFNPDESQQIAGAITLARDPIFWRSVDGMTAGPLNFYALLPLHWLGLPLDYFTARMMGLLLIGGSLITCLQALANSFGRTIAWLCVLPGLAFFATATHYDLIHYSSEHVALLLVATSCWLLMDRKPGDGIPLWGASVLAGTAPLAKLQTAPIALTLFAWACWLALQEQNVPRGLRIRRVLGLGVAASAVPFVATILVTVTGQIDTALQRYVVHNLTYVERGNNRGMSDVLREMTGMAMLDGRAPLLLSTVAVVVLAAFLVIRRRRVRPSLNFVAGGFLTLAALIAVVVPQREFLHYFLLLPVPLTIWLGAAAGGWWQQLATSRSRGLLAAFLLFLGMLPPIATRCFLPLPPICGSFSHHWRYPYSKVAMVVRALTNPTDSLGIWGWATNLYVETGLPQATRDGLSSWSILPGKLRDYHRGVYLADLQRNRPALFVDAVGPGAYAFEHRALHAHENFPALADYIRSHYILVRDVHEARIYARKDLPALASLDPLKIDTLLARGRPNDRVKTFSPPALSPDILPRKEIDSRVVTMLLPPARVEWPIDQKTREVSFQYGFDPEAYERGESNGAEFVLELINLGQHRTVFRRLLDPARVQTDRGLQTTLVTLPPFGPDTRLVLRTEPGPFGNNAWDWIYLADLQLKRSPTFLPGQFPGFNRVPDDAYAEGSYVLNDDTKSWLHLPAPAALTFNLKGGEQRLNFDFGLPPGAYTDGGHTDGAIIRVELKEGDRAARILFERYLNPGTERADQGDQHLDLALPATSSGTRLIVSIDPGPALNPAWDWTYIRHFVLQ